MISTILILGAFYYFIGKNPIEISGYVNHHVQTFVPQGWAFFTRSPREAQIILYQVSENRTLSKYPQKHSSYKSLFGIDRRASKLLTEIQALKSKINDSVFVNIEWNYQKTNSLELPTQLPIIVRENEIFNPLLCGEFVLVFQKPVPWAWSKSIKELEMPAKIIRLKINCYED